MLRLLVASAVVALSTAAKEPDVGAGAIDASDLVSDGAKFDVTNYGAVGDGSHDDTAAIAKALSAAAAAATALSRVELQRLSHPHAAATTSGRSAPARAGSRAACWGRRGGARAHADGLSGTGSVPEPG